MRRFVSLLPAGIALATLLAFWPVVPGEFNWDDQASLVTNPHYRGLAWPQLRWMFTTTIMGHYVPLTWVSLGLNYVVGGMDPRGYHLTSLLLHATNATLVYVIAKRLLLAARLGAGAAFAGPPGPGVLAGGAAVAALLFALHPQRVEPVAWISDRGTVLCGTFYLLAVLAYLRAGATAPLRGRWWGCASLVAFAAALLSKGMAMSLPITLLVLDVYPLRRWRGNWRRAVVEKIPYAVLAIAGAGIALAARSQGAELTDYARYGAASRIGLVGYSLWFYPFKLVWPTDLSPLYEVPGHTSILEPRFLTSIAAALVTTAGLILLRRRVPVRAAARRGPLQLSGSARLRRARGLRSGLDRGAAAARGGASPRGDDGPGRRGLDHHRARANHVEPEPCLARSDDTLELGGGRRSALRHLPQQPWNRAPASGSRSRGSRRGGAPAPSGPRARSRQRGGAPQPGHGPSLARATRPGRRGLAGLPGGSTRCRRRCRASRGALPDRGEDRRGDPPASAGPPDERRRPARSHERGAVSRALTHRARGGGPTPRRRRNPPVPRAGLARGRAARRRGRCASAGGRGERVGAGLPAVARSRLPGRWAGEPGRRRASVPAASRPDGGSSDHGPPGRTRSRPLAREGSDVTLKRLEGRGADRGVLLAGAPADSDAPHHVAVHLDGEASHEDREAARMHGVDAEGLVAWQGGPARRLIESVGGPAMACRGEGLGDGDLHPGDARAGHAVERDGMPAVVADADGLGHSDLARLALGRGREHQRVLQREPLDGDHGSSTRICSAASTRTG